MEVRQGGDHASDALFPIVRPQPPRKWGWVARGPDSHTSGSTRFSLQREENDNSEDVSVPTNPSESPDFESIDFQAFSRFHTQMYPYPFCRIINWHQG